MLSPLLREILACPVDRAPVTIDDAAGTVTCSSCGRVYPIIEGIPVMLESEARHTAGTPVSGIAVVSGVVKDYVWGRIDGLTTWTSSTGAPQAELWFGTHPSGSSPVVAVHGRDGQIPDETDVTAPLLTKVLSVNAPLSVQVHPDREALTQMRARGWDHLLSDDGLKAEMLIAIEPFLALAGMRPAEECRRLLEGLGLADAAAAAQRGDMADAIRRAVAQPHDARAWDTVTAGLPDLDREILTAVSEFYPEDRGRVVALLMRPWRLAPGESLYVAPGTLHAYVHGLALEVMTSSDNVLRLGLTPKVVDVEASLAAMRPEGQPQFQALPLESPRHYTGPNRPFSVREIRGADDIAAGVGRGGMVVALSGSALLSTPHRQVTVPHGHAGLVLGDGRWDVSVDTDNGWALVAYPTV